jgi:CxxC motif-containing protein (DUF1111 family)
MRLGDVQRIVLIVGACLLLTAEAMGGHGRGTVSREYAEALALFEKLWTPGEASPNGGDGLGPLYNERSCVGCHFQAGTGGAGDNTRNVAILSAVPTSTGTRDQRSILKSELEDIHPGFRGRSSIVLHAQSTSRDGGLRLGEIRNLGLVQTRDDLFQLSESRRSTPALFGAGRIDRISDRELLAAEARTYPDFPEITGRVSRLRGGKLGRFGWKGQTTSLEEFVMAACANELGLEVRGHHQPSLQKDFEPAGLSLDLSDSECALLTRFVANLPAPSVRPVGAAYEGFAVFQAIGCATCHTPTMGGARLYSDLLLHDLGDRFRAFGGGYGSRTTDEIVDRAPKEDLSTTGEAGPTEWRTAPLWGVADSAPYLHDGRARTLNDAIILHGGEAEPTSKRYSQLPVGERQALLAFLHSQVAPPQPSPKRR